MRTISHSRVTQHRELRLEWWVLWLAHSPKWQTGTFICGLGCSDCARLVALGGLRVQCLTFLNPEISWRYLSRDFKYTQPCWQLRQNENYPMFSTSHKGLLASLYSWNTRPKHLTGGLNGTLTCSISSFWFLQTRAIIGSFAPRAFHPLLS